MGPRVLHIFNPEHDLALAVGHGPYTPPKKIAELRKEKSLLPAIFADKGDFLLVSPDVPDVMISRLPHYTTVCEKDLVILRDHELANVANIISEVKPWGWDHAIRERLLSANIPEFLLPSLPQIAKIRELSHRRTSIPFRKRIAELAGQNLKHPAQEIFSLKEAENFLKKYPKTFFKAPWSSSGRGITVSDHISHRGLLEWISGILRSQKSVIAEPAWNRVFDFATEWKTTNGKALFLGYSVFETSSRGKYHHNLEATQEELREKVLLYAPDFEEQGLPWLQMALEEYVAPYYSGPLGIDLLTDMEGDINYCVEINLRNTMGHLLLNIQKKD